AFADNVTVIPIGKDSHDGHLDAIVNGQPVRYFFDIQQYFCEEFDGYLTTLFSGFTENTASPLALWVDCVSPDAKVVGPNTVYTNGYPITFPPAGTRAASAPAAVAGTSSVAYTPWAEPDGNANEATGCSPFHQIAPSPVDRTTFYVGSGCGVMQGSSDGLQLVSMNAGLPEHLEINALTIAL